MWTGIGAAALATGGAAIPALGAIGGIGSAVGAGANMIDNMGKQASVNRQIQDAQKQDWAMNASRYGMNAANTEIAQRADQRAAAEAAYQNALRAAFAANAQDVNIDRSQFRSNVPNISFGGGTRPSAIGPIGRQAAQLMAQQSLGALQNPQPYMKIPDMGAFPEPSKAGFWEKLAGPVALGMTGASEVMKGIDAMRQARGAQGLSPVPEGLSFNSPVFNIQPRNDMLPQGGVAMAPVRPQPPVQPFVSSANVGQSIRW
jgi:hypothetical protein